MLKQSSVHLQQDDFGVPFCLSTSRKKTPLTYFIIFIIKYYTRSSKNIPGTFLTVLNYFKLLFILWKWNSNIRKYYIH